MKCWSHAVVALLVGVLLVLLFNAEGADAKRGCSVYGHSCYGGLGKRGPETLSSNGEIPEDMPQREENPDLIFTGPRSDYRLTHEEKLVPRQLYNISPLLRQWLQAYRRVQELHSDAV